MKLIAETLTEVILKESSKSPDDKKMKEFEKLLTGMKNVGVIKNTNYNIPLVDTIGKIYYTSINKREQDYKNFR